MLWLQDEICCPQGQRSILPCYSHHSGVSGCLLNPLQISTTNTKTGCILGCGLMGRFRRSLNNKQGEGGRDGDKGWRRETERKREWGRREGKKGGKKGKNRKEGEREREKETNWQNWKRRERLEANKFPKSFFFWGQKNSTESVISGLTCNQRLLSVHPGAATHNLSSTSFVRQELAHNHRTRNWKG